jgi:endonuclease/exonuclease/phosphatase (EEP) superfamily protein YafD
VRLSRILIAATGAELCIGAGLVGLLGLGGYWSGLLDGFNHIAPVVLATAILGAALARLALPKAASRRLVLACAVAGVLAPAANMAPDLSAAALGLLPQKPGGAPLRVLHFNVWTENFDPRRTAQAIIDSGADVVLMQEGAGTMSSQFGRIRAAYPYQAACRRLWVCGQVIWSKRPIERWGALVPRPPLQPDSLGVVWARITAPDGKPALLVTTHLNWPVPPGQQASQRAKLVRYLATLPKDDMILSGDFNSTPWSFALRRLDGGLRPLDRKTRAYFSWPANVARMRRAFPLPLMPIDHVYAGPNWRTTKLRRLPRQASDHYAVMASFSR